LDGVAGKIGLGKLIAFSKSLMRLVLDRSYRRSLGYRVPSATLSQNSEREFYLATATIIRDEAKYIREFVAFHKLVGVSHMLLYMDGGTDNDVVAQLADFVREGFVELIPWPRFIRERNNQFLAFQHASQYMLGRTKWLAMFDADEFLFAPQSGDLVGELKKREAFAALSIYSRTFGTGGVARIGPGELVIEHMTKRANSDHPKNRTQRTIAKPEVIAAIRSANTCVLRDTSCLGWDEDGKAVYATGEAGHNCEQIRINHYFTRAEEDFRAKLARSYFGKTALAQKMTAKAAEAENGVLSEVSDVTLHSYLTDLKKLHHRSR
jgi:Glycosyltransferase family 92